MAERGFITLAFDPSYTGESGGEPRHVASPDINTEDFSAAVDYLGLLANVDRERLIETVRYACLSHKGVVRQPHDATGTGGGATDVCGFFQYHDAFIVCAHPQGGTQTTATTPYHNLVKFFVEHCFPYALPMCKVSKSGPVRHRRWRTGGLHR